MLIGSHRITPMKWTRKILYRVYNNKWQYDYYAKLYKQRQDSRKLFSLFCYFLYKTIREYTIATTSLTVSTNGYKIMTIPNDSGISEELRIFKTHEPLTTELIKKILKEGMICVDLGCNLGYYALLESKLVKNTGKIFAFEPSPVTYEHFRKNLELNETSNVESYNIAIGNIDDKIKFLLSKKSNWCRVIDDSTNVSNSNIIEVPMITLDSFASKHSLKKIDFIRMDIEGYEDKAYDGMTQVIKQFKPSLYMEIHPHFMGLERTKSFFEKLKKDGYEIKYFTQRITDTPWISDPKNDVKDITLDELTKILPKIYGFNFSLFLVNRN